MILLIHLSLRCDQIPKRLPKFRRTTSPQPASPIHRIQRHESKKRSNICDGAVLVDTSMRSTQRALHTLAQQTMSPRSHLANLTRLPQMRDRQAQRTRETITRRDSQLHVHRL